MDHDGSAATAMLGLPGFVLLAVSADDGEVVTRIDPPARNHRGMPWDIDRTLAMRLSHERALQAIQEAPNSCHGSNTHSGYDNWGLDPDMPMRPPTIADTWNAEAPLEQP